MSSRHPARLVIHTAGAPAHQPESKVTSHIGLAPSRPIGPTHLVQHPPPPSETVTFRITEVDLDSVAVLGSGEVTANGIDTDNLALSIPGSGDIAANDAAATIEVTISGSGGVDAVLTGAIGTQTTAR